MAYADVLRAKRAGSLAPLPEADPSLWESTKSGFASFADWIDKPFQAVGGILTGDPSYAARSLAEFTLNPLDVLLPGNVIDFTDPQERIRGLDLLGVGDEYREESPWMSFLGDAAVETALNPLSWVTAGGAGAAGQVAKAATKFQALSKAAAKAGAKVGWGARLTATADDFIRHALEATAKGKGKAQVIDDIVEQADGNFGLAAQLVKGTKAAKHFDQGGLRFAGAQFMGPGPLTNITGKIVDPLSGVLGPSIKWLRQATGNLSTGAAEDAIIGSSRALGEQAEKTLRQASGKVRGLNAEEAHAFTEVFENMRLDAKGRPTAGLLDEASELLPTDRVDLLRAAYGDAAEKVNWDKVSAAVDEWQNIAAPAALKTKRGAGLVVGAAADYKPRRFVGERFETFGGEEVAEAFGVPSSMAKRSLQNDQQVLDFLRENASAALETDARKTIERYIHQHRRQLASAKLAERILGKGVKVDSKTMNALREVAADMEAASPDFAMMIRNTVNGVMPRGSLEKVLSVGNKFFKKAAVMGVMIPNITGIMRNRLGGTFQALAVQGPGAALKNAYRLIPDFGKATADALGTKLSGDDVSRFFRTVEDALKKSGGDLDAYRAAIAQTGDKHLVEALDLGILDNYVSTEELLDGFIRNKYWRNTMDMPANMFSNLESRMRLASFVDLRTAGYSAEYAAKVTQDTFIDYSITGIANRRMRDLIPFLTFTAKTIPQHIRAMARNPVLATGHASVFRGDPSAPQEEWMRENIAIPMGENQMLTATGLPFEALSTVAIGSGRDVEREMVSMAHPLLKTAYSAVTSRDPFFGGEAFRYDKAPALARAMGMDDRGEVWRHYRTAAGTGIPQALVTPVRQLGKALHPDMDPMQRAMNVLTGANIHAVDPQKAEIDKLRTILKEEGVREGAYFYGLEEDDPLYAVNKQLQRLLRERSDARKRQAIHD